MNGIQEVVGSIPIVSTTAPNGREKYRKSGAFLLFVRSGRERSACRAFARFFRSHLGIHLTALISAAVIGLYFLLRPCKGLMNFLIRWVTTPYKQAMAAILSLLPFSMAELIWAVGIIGVPILIFQTVYRMFRPGGRLRRIILYRRIAGLCAAVLTVYAGFCQLVNEYAPQVERDEAGCFSVSRDEIFSKAGSIYDAVGEEFPFLSGSLPTPKRIFFSRIMSYVDFTGFFFPFTDEANLNTDSPACLLPSTITHELAHQKNIAPEQEANFVAILTALKSNNPVYCYSAALLGYIHLSNALYKADRIAWEQVYGSLDARVRADLSANNAYWQQFQTPVNQATQTVYNSFLQSYGQELGVKSYGACVDLLVACYCPEE